MEAQAAFHYHLMVFPLICYIDNELPVKGGDQASPESHQAKRLFWTSPWLIGWPQTSPFPALGLRSCW